MRSRPALAPPRAIPVGEARRTIEVVRVWRTNTLFGILLLLLAAMMLRFAWFQLVRGPSMREQANRRHAARMTLAGVRGRILDRHGRLLATSAFGREVAVDPDPQVLPEDRLPAFCAQLAATLDDDRLTAGVLQRRLEQARGERRVLAGPLGLRWMRTGVRHLVLVPYVSEPRVVAGLDDAADQRDMRPLKVRVVERRAYPNGDYAMHVIGVPVPQGGQAGQGEGVEGLLDRHLYPGQLSVTVSRDGKARMLADEPLFDRDLLAGRDVRLTLDVVLQHHVEREMDALVAAWKPFQACAVVLDPGTGQVLAMASRACDPSTGARVPSSNLPIRGLYEPGSVFKPFTVAWALRQGLPPSTVVPMPLSVHFPGDRKAISDTHFVGDGDLARLLSESSNTGAAWLADWMGGPALQGMFTWLGLDQPTGLELPHEVCWGKAHRMRGRSDFLRSGFGHALTMTPIRLASAFTAFARADARAARPTLMLDTVSPVTPGEPICPPHLLGMVRQGLVGCVETGTAASAFKGSPFSAAGKTGTAVIHAETQHVCSFVGYAPANAPRLVVLVSAVTRRSQQGSGGRVSAPAVRKILDRSLPYLGVAPDRGEAVAAEGRP